MAHRNPLVLVFEDIHWADHGMLDLIEYLAQWVRGPLMLFCLARDELLERRSAWGGGRLDATSILLEPLSMEETERLVGALLPQGAASGDGAVKAIAERAGGNPFFAEEMARRLAEEAGGGLVELPHSGQSPLAARPDSPEPPGRPLGSHAPGVGRTVWEGARAAGVPGG